jgi:hypothetical protein
MPTVAATTLPANGTTYAAGTKHRALESDIHEAVRHCDEPTWSVEE